MQGEFGLIKRYFSRPTPSAVLGVGDDCALLNLPAGYVLATSTDTLIEGRHFLSNTLPNSLGHKSLAVNLSDLAAMGAKPLGCLLNLALPEVNHEWLQGFSDGFYKLAEESNCPLVGGDTTRSLNGIFIAVTVLGYVDAKKALRRNAAQAKDDIWITGNVLGAPDIALRLLRGSLDPNEGLLKATINTLQKPEPPINFATSLCGFAHAAIDISDGLLQDLQHVLSASGCGAVLFYPKLPIHEALNAVDQTLQREAVLAGGDIYQLCFTAPPKHRQAIIELAKSTGVVASRVGQITAESGLRVIDNNNQNIATKIKGFDHFNS